MASRKLDSKAAPQRQVFSTDNGSNPLGRRVFGGPDQADKTAPDYRQRDVLDGDFLVAGGHRGAGSKIVPPPPPRRNLVTGPLITSPRPSLSPPVQTLPLPPEKQDVPNLTDKHSEEAQRRLKGDLVVENKVGGLAAAVELLWNTKVNDQTCEVRTLTLHRVVGTETDAHELCRVLVERLGGRKLDRLDLRNAHIDNAFLQELLPLIRTNQISELNVANTLIDSQGIGQIAVALSTQSSVNRRVRARAPMILKIDPSQSAAASSAIDEDLATITVVRH